MPLIEDETDMTKERMDYYMEFMRRNSRNIPITYNAAIDQLSLRMLVGMMKKCGIKGPLVCPGSGDGVNINAIRDEMPDELAKVICIDPAPNSYNGGRSKKMRGIKPKYPLVRDYLRQNPRAVGNVNVLLDWPTSSKEGRYDIESIFLLRPRKLVIIFDSMGGSGSDWLLSWLANHVEDIEKAKLTINYGEEFPQQMYAIPRYRYVKAHSKIVPKSYYINNVGGQHQFAYLFLERCDLN